MSEYIIYIYIKTWNIYLPGDHSRDHLLMFLSFSAMNRRCFRFPAGSNGSGGFNEWEDGGRAKGGYLGCPPSQELWQMKV